MKKLAEYLDKMNAERYWKDADLARVARIDQSTLTRLRYDDDRMPTMRTLEKLAKAYKVPLMEVQRAVGLIPDIAREDALTAELLHLASQMTIDELEGYKRIGRSLLEQRSKKNETTPALVLIS